MKKLLYGERETEYKGWVVTLTVNITATKVRAANGGCEIMDFSKSTSERGISAVLLKMREAIDNHPLTLSLARGAR